MIRDKIIIVEDDPGISKYLQAALRSHGYDTLLAPDGKTALEMIASHCPDLLLLDLGLPDMDGSEIIRSVRAWSRMPIIIISARSAEIDKAAALDMGADDYLTKPFGTVELLARIRAVLRRNQGAVEASGVVDDDIPLVCGDISMQVGQHQVTVRGESVFFPLKEFELLEYLMQNKGRVMTRHQLIDRIWGSDYVGDTKTLDVHVKRGAGGPNHIPQTAHSNYVARSATIHLLFTDFVFRPLEQPIG